MTMTPDRKQAADALAQVDQMTRRRRGGGLTAARKAAQAVRRQDR